MPATHDLIGAILANWLDDRLLHYESEQASLLAEINSSTIDPTRKQDEECIPPLLTGHYGRPGLSAELNRVQMSFILSRLSLCYRETEEDINY